LINAGRPLLVELVAAGMTFALGSQGGTACLL